MSEDNKRLVASLLGLSSRRVSEMEQEEVVPAFLAAKYARQSAAQRAAEAEVLTPALTAALLRAAFLRRKKTFERPLGGRSSCATSTLDECEAVRMRAREFSRAR